ncbi:glycosyltransferase family 2 protein [Roseomonas haemaphysalidis]|uniref:Glycosyltransferase family 2 protein n=1 Tax=Roseomonas haemaphysalidis TaxID=2768162 RepID=A0ABS3KNL9_9PROT|nr:glycosyltransferase family 2 protein [Roseomonas haemaphysalidis]MBO1078632.1 glycosyltransferase family 2 protein [Roseomonas haemaphysalidis]
MTDRSATHLVLIPSFNSGPLVLSTVRGARAAWSPVWVVVDGSTDGTGAALQAMAAGDPGLRVMLLPRNQGKGAAVLHGLEAAAAAGFTHALTMDADGQHPADRIAEFMALSAAEPAAMVLGEPIFGPEAPLARVRGRRLSNACANLETLWAGIGDSLFGFRVYPVAPLLAVMRAHRWMRRYDFDAEAAVRLAWRGVPARNVRVPVRYLKAEDGGVSHFHYVRDNILLSWMHLRLGAGFLARLPRLVRARAGAER